MERRRCADSREKGADPGPSARGRRSGLSTAGAVAALWMAVFAPRSMAADPLVVGAAASLREPIAAIAAAFESGAGQPRVALVFGASSALAAQLRAGAPIDVLISADQRIVDALVRDGMLDAVSVRRLARNRLVLIASEDWLTRTGLRPPIEPRDAFAAPDVRLALPGPAVPVGRYAREWIAARRLEDALPERIAVTEHARATLAAVDAGHADIAIVYASDASVATRARTIFAIPEDQQPQIVYAAARASGANGRADAWLAYLAAPAAALQLERAGLTPTGGTPP